jgi:hypothetical protein
MNDTEHPDSRNVLQTLVRRTFVRACEDLGVKYTAIASALELGSSSIVERWTKLAPLPVWVLANPEAIPEPLFNRIIAVVEAQRTVRGAGLRPTCEGAAFGVLSTAGETVSELSRLLADFKLSADERPAARVVAHKLIAKGEALLRAIDDAERVEGSGSARVCS